MNVLLDTHVLLWAAGQPSRLAPETRAMIENPDQRPWFSAACLWEIAIKRSLGHADFDVEPRRLRRGLLDHGWNELAVTSEHVIATMDLPPLHKDPFDRMLIAQAHVEGFDLVTSNDLVAQYPGRIRRV